VQLFIHPLKVSFSKKEKYTIHPLRVSISKNLLTASMSILVFKMPALLLKENFHDAQQIATDPPSGHHRKNKIK
jgi:hypothetical protein